MGRKLLRTAGMLFNSWLQNPCSPVYLSVLILISKVKLFSSTRQWLFFLTLMTVKGRKRTLKCILYKNSYTMLEFNQVFVSRTKPGRLTLTLLSRLVVVVGDP